MTTFVVYALRMERDFVTKCSGHNCDFTYSEEMDDIYVFLLKDRNGIMYELKLYVDEGECGSGWCTASYGRSYLESVNEFRGMTHLPITPDDEIYFNCDEEIENKYFNYSSYGDDDYYPQGYVNVHMNEFVSVSEMSMTKSANKV